MGKKQWCKLREIFVFLTMDKLDFWKSVTLWGWWGLFRHWCFRQLYVVSILYFHINLWLFVFFIADLQRKLITFECSPEVIDAIVATLCKVWCMYISCFRPMSNAQISVCFWLLSNEWQLVATLRPWNSWAPLWLWNSPASPIRVISVKEVLKRLLLLNCVKKF